MATNPTPRSSGQNPGRKAPGAAPKAPGKQHIDPLLAQRLDHLNTRRPAAGGTLPPPKPGTRIPAQGQAGRQALGQAGKVGAGTATATKANAAQADKLAALAARSAAARSGGAGGSKRPGGAPGARKGKPAAASKIASLAVSVATATALAGYFAGQSTTSDSVILTSGTDVLGGATTTTPATTPATTATTAAGGTTASTTASTAAPTTVAASGAIADGTYQGQAYQNRFGTVQVQVVYSGGQLTDVQILSYPDGDRRSISINQYALPKLINQAIKAQSANISGVSGATYTSVSYYKSLQSAIDNAKAASGLG